MIGSRRLGFRTFEKDADRLGTELFSGDDPFPPGPIGTAAWNHIHLIPPGGATVTSYPVTVAGLLAALTAATVAGSMIWIPPGTFNTAITIPANIALVALGEKVSINGQWTLNSGVVVANIVQTQSSSSAGALSGVVGPSSGIAYMKNCSITVENSGAGDAYAVNQSGAGELWLWACATYGNASGGGEGYGARQSAGTLHVSDDGRHRGSTGKFSGTVQLFSFEDVIHLKTSTFTQLYNATEAGVTAMLAAASSGDTVEFPRHIAISITSGITLTSGVRYKNFNLVFSGFSGVAVTLATDVRLVDGYVEFDGTGQAEATAIKGLDLPAGLRDVTAYAHDATTNRGIWVRGLDYDDNVGMNNCGGIAYFGTTSIGIRLENFVTARKSSGQATAASATNVGLLFAGSSSNITDMPLSQGGWHKGNGGGDYAGAVEAGDYGIAISDTYIGGNFLIDTGGTLISRGSYYNDVVNNGTHLNDLIIVNVRDYGADPANSVAANDTAITNAISALPSTGGILYFPSGSYNTSGGFTLADNVTVLGAGPDITFVYCNSATAVLFNVTANVAFFRDIRLENNAVSTPSAGAGIRTSGAIANQSVSYSSVVVKGFYINWDIQVGTSWTMEKCRGPAPHLYSVKIQNTVEDDAGDWSIDGCSFSDGANDADAAIRIESSGGGKIVNTKINGNVSGRFNHGIDMSIGAGVATSILLISNCSIENIRGDAVHIVTTGGGIWPYMLFSNVQTGMYLNTTGYAIYMNAATLGDLTGVNITNCHFHADASNTNPAINLTNVDEGNISGCTYSGFDSLISRTTCTDVYVFNPGTDAIEIAEIAAPGTPPSGDGYIYEKTDGLLYFKNDAGTEYDLTDAGAFDISALTEELTIDGVNDEAVFYDDSASAHRKIPPWRFQSSSRMIYAQTADQQIVSTTDETTLLGDGSGTLTVPANALLAGTTIRIKAFGELSDTGTPSPTLKITLGGTTLATATPTLTGVTGVKWSFDGWISIRTIGATGTVQAGGLFDYNDGTEVTLLSAADVTIDTTAALDVDLTWTWDVSSASNDITSRWSEAEVLNPPPGSVTAGSAFRITEAGDNRITEASDTRITEG